MYSPDEIANIRAEQMADAMPSEEEAKAMHQDYLRREGCNSCGEDDPAELDVYEAAYPSCPALQRPDDLRVVYCEECAAARPSLRERAYKRATKSNERGHYPNKKEGKVVAVTFFECEDWHFVRVPLMDDGHGQYARHPFGRPSTPIECRCGADIMRIERLDELAEEFEDEDGDGDE